ncbi:MAG: small ribosomal subunit Rsm22 family protein [Roseiflexaceae bacterium]
MIELPVALQHAIRQSLHPYSSHQWSDAARRLSERYRSVRDGSPLVTSEIDALAYTAMLMPATYAQLVRAIGMWPPHLDNSGWQSVLDIGSGPGTALWALHTLMPHITVRTAIERDPHFVALAQQLCKPLVGHTTFVQQDITHNPTWPTHDVVIIGHVLNELSATQRTRVIEAAWAATNELLVIVEPGTSAFFGMIRDIRRQLIDQGAHVVAPCTHDMMCPMSGDDWCHFGQKIARPDFQRQARAVQVGWEEAKVSFVAVSKRPVAISGQRIIHDPIHHKGFVALPVCDHTGLHTRSILKRHKATHARARRMSWGDFWNDDSPK